MERVLSILQINQLLIEKNSAADPRPTQKLCESERRQTLLKQRAKLITTITGNTNVAYYDVNIAAKAQSLGVSYNGAVRVSNEATALLARVTGRVVQLYQPVHELPWETEKLSRLIDKLMSATGVSFAAAVVIVMGKKPCDTNLPCSDWEKGFNILRALSQQEIKSWCATEDDLFSGYLTW